MVVMVRPNDMVVSRVVSPTMVSYVGWAQSGDKVRFALFFDDKQPTWVFEPIDEHELHAGRGVERISEFFAALSDVRSITRDKICALKKFSSFAAIKKEAINTKDGVPPPDELKQSIKQLSTKRAESTHASKYMEVVNSPNYAHLVVEAQATSAREGRGESFFSDPKMVRIVREPGERYGVTLAVLVVTAVVEGSPAERAGLPKYIGWNIVEVDNARVGSLEEFNKATMHKTAINIKLMPPTRGARKFASIRAERSPRAASPVKIARPPTPPESIVEVEKDVPLHAGLLMEECEDEEGDISVFMPMCFEYADMNCYYGDGRTL